MMNMLFFGGGGSRSGALSRLERLSIGTIVIPAAVMDRIRLGGCHHLKTIKMTGLDPESANALATAITSLPLIHLEELSISCNKVWHIGRNVSPEIGDVGVARVVKALATHCHKMTKLDLTNNGKEPLAGEALIEALGGNAWPYLTYLSLEERSHDSRWRKLLI